MCGLPESVSGTGVLGRFHTFLAQIYDQYDQVQGNAGTYHSNPFDLAQRAHVWSR